ncbi:MAG: hypothetical protein ACLPXM_18195 [Terriglobales bacterium]
MKRTKPLAVIASAVLCASLAFAQNTASAPASSTPTTRSGRFSLGLTQQQKTQLHNLRTSMQDQIAIIRHDPTLSGEQQQQLTQMKAARQAKLGLTQAQQAQLKSLFSGVRQQRETVLNNASLSNVQKQAQLQQIRQNIQTQLGSILTPDQLQKMHHMRHGWGWHGNS